MNNIEKSKEYQLAKGWKMDVNSDDFDPKENCDANPVDAPDASTEPLSAHKGVCQSNG